MAKPDKILAHELLDREVLDLRAGEVAGSVVDFGINREGKVQLIGILPVAWYGGGRGITPASITFLTEDRLCIANGDALEDFAPDGDVLISTNSGGQIYGKTVLLHDGEMLGELADFRFNLGDGKITDLLVLDGDDRRTRIPIEKITTIGKDYIIIERGAAAADSDAAGEASPFSSAAAVEPEPAAAESIPASLPPARGGKTKSKAATGALQPKAVERAPEPAPAWEAAPAPSPTWEAPAVEAPAEPPVGASSWEAVAEPAAVTDWPATAAPAVAEAETVSPAVLDEAPPVAMEDTAPAATEAWSEAASEPVPAPDHGPVFDNVVAPAAGLDSVFDVPAAPLSSEPEVDPLFEVKGVQISKFDQKKLDFLRGKLAHRDIKDTEGIILVAKDEELDQPALMRIVQGGVLGEVFIEMTLKK
jgi:sporulation protein YlmC with PRC-barrel domain